MKTLIKNTPAFDTLIYTGQIGHEVQIIVDAGEKMFECFVNLYELELAWFGKDPRSIPFDIRQNREWTNDPAFLKKMVLRNLEITEEIEP